MATDQELLKRLLAMFRVEAHEHIQAIASGLISLEKASTDAEQLPVLDVIFRSAHSLKGAARAVNLTEIESVCQSVEDIFAALKKRQIHASPDLFDLMHRAADLLGQLSSSVETGTSTVSKSQAGGLVAALRDTLRGKSAETPANHLPPPPAELRDAQQPERGEKLAASDTVRIPVSKLDAVLLQTEELLSLKLAANQRAEDLNQIQAKFSEWEKRWAKLRPDTRAFQQAVERKEDQNSANAQWSRLAEFLSWNQEFLEMIRNELGDAARAAGRNKRATGALVDNLLDEVKKAVMLPCSTLTDVFPRFVRELSREQGKEVDLAVSGGEIEVDRRILEEMKDPLVHLVRNCLDHGMEKPDARIQRGKPARGTISISLSPINGSHVEFLISDDGAGIDAEKVKAAASKLGLQTPREAMSAKDALPLIFESGISTSPIITDISGRGLGLAIVKEKVEKLNGVLSVETELGRGTSFRIVLPLTLSRFRGVAVRVQEQLFIVPTGNVERAVRLKKGDIKTVENRETISVRGETLSLARLNRALAMPAKMNARESAETFPAVVLTAGNQRIAFLVDEIFNEEEVLVKAPGKQLVRVQNIAGVTVLGNGKVVPILNVSDLMRSAVRTAAAAGESVAAPAKSAETGKKSILVAEDSITSRSLLKNILEASGYRVETAVDGIDAFTKLRSGQFDIVVSDVDMPRMNGFGLTAKIRSDKKLAELPVILVTSLNSRADREHGIDVGANAYIIKSNFDQGNLLETIQRLA